MKTVLLVLLFLLVTSPAYAQDSWIKGTIRDSLSGQTLSDIEILIRMDNGRSIAGRDRSDLDGNYSIRPLNPGKYIVEATYKHQVIITSGIILGKDAALMCNIFFHDPWLSLNPVSDEYFNDVIYRKWELPKIDSEAPNVPRREQIR
jgi:hypothetical protein